MKKPIALVCSLLTIIAAMAQDVAPSTNTSDPEMEVFLLVFAMAFIAAVIVAVILIVIAIVALIVLTTVGIVSGSVLYGFYKRSFQSGLKFFILISFTILGAGAGVLGYFASTLLPSISIQINYALLLASFAGAAGGLLAGYASLAIIKRFYASFNKKWKTLKTS